MILRIAYLLIIISFNSCKLISVGQGKALASEPLIGTVGTFDEDIFSAEFTQAGLPQLDEKIKLAIGYKFFNNRSLRKFNSSVGKEGQKLQIVDSINLKPGYFVMEISNKIGLIKALNQPSNKGLKDYLEATKNNQILTAVEIYFPPQISSLLENATEIYLVNNNKSSYSMELLNNDGTTKIVNFNEGNSFGFEFMAFCWKENYKRNADIAAFRNLSSPCPGSTFKNPDKIYRDDIFKKLN